MRKDKDTNDIKVLTKNSEMFFTFLTSSLQYHIKSWVFPNFASFTAKTASSLSGIVLSPYAEAAIDMGAAMLAAVLEGWDVYNSTKVTTRMNAGDTSKNKLPPLLHDMVAYGLAWLPFIIIRGSIIPTVVNSITLANPAAGAVSSIFLKTLGSVISSTTGGILYRFYAKWAKNATVIQTQRYVPASEGRSILKFAQNFAMTDNTFENMIGIAFLGGFFGTFIEGIVSAKLTDWINTPSTSIAESISTSLTSTLKSDASSKVNLVSHFVPGVVLGTMGWSILTIACTLTVFGVLKGASWGIDKADKKFRLNKTAAMRYLANGIPYETENPSKGYHSFIA